MKSFTSESSEDLKQSIFNGNMKIHIFWMGEIPDFKKFILANL